MRVTGNNEVIDNLEKMRARLGVQVADQLYASGVLVRNVAVKSIQEVSPGQEVTRYRNGGNSYSHVAAKRGDAPNTDTGALVKSIAVVSDGKDVYVGSALEYARHLEINGHPWLIPAAKGSLDKIRKMLVNGVKRVIK